MCSSDLRGLPSAAQHLESAPSSHHYRGQTHIFVLRTSLSLSKQLLLDPPSGEVALHAILERLRRRVRSFSEPQQRLDYNPYALVSAGGAQARLVEDGEESREEAGERRRVDDRCGKGSEVREEENLRVET